MLTGPMLQKFTKRFEDLNKLKYQNSEIPYYSIYEQNVHPHGEIAQQDSYEIVSISSGDYSEDRVLKEEDSSDQHDHENEDRQERKSTDQNQFAQQVNQIIKDDNSDIFHESNSSKNQEKCQRQIKNRQIQIEQQQQAKSIELQQENLYQFPKESQQKYDCTREYNKQKDNKDKDKDKDKKNVLQKIKNKIALYKTGVNNQIGSQFDKYHHVHAQTDKSIVTRKRGRPPKSKNANYHKKNLQKVKTNNFICSDSNSHSQSSQLHQKCKDQQEHSKRDIVIEYLKESKNMKNEEKALLIKAKTKQYKIISTHQFKIWIDAYEMILNVENQIKTLPQRPDQKTLSKKFANQFIRYVRRNIKEKRYKFRRICAQALKQLNLVSHRVDNWLNRFMVQNRAHIVGIDLTEYQAGLGQKLKNILQQEKEALKEESKWEKNKQKQSGLRSSKAVSSFFSEERKNGSRKQRDLYSVNQQQDCFLDQKQSFSKVGKKNNKKFQKAEEKARNGTKQKYFSNSGNSKNSNSLEAENYPMAFKLRIAAKLDSTFAEILKSIIKQKCQQYCVQETTLKEIYEQFGSYIIKKSNSNQTFRPVQRTFSNIQLRSAAPANNIQSKNYDDHNQGSAKQRQGNLAIYDNIEGVNRENGMAGLSKMQNFISQSNGRKLSSFPHGVSATSPQLTNRQSNQEKTGQQIRFEDFQRKMVNPCMLLLQKLSMFLKSKPTVTENEVKQEAINIIKSTAEIGGKIRQETLSRLIYDFIEKNRQRIEGNKIFKNPASEFLNQDTRTNNDMTNKYPKLSQQQKPTLIETHLQPKIHIRPYSTLPITNYFNPRVGLLQANNQPMLPVRNLNVSPVGNQQRNTSSPNILLNNSQNLGKANEFKSSFGTLPSQDPHMKRLE